MDKSSLGLVGGVSIRFNVCSEVAYCFWVTLYTVATGCNKLAILLHWRYCALLG